MICSLLQINAHDEPPKTQKEKNEAEAKRNKIIKNKITRITIWEFQIENGVATENKHKYAELNYNVEGLNTSILVYKSNDTLEGRTVKVYDYSNSMICDFDFEGTSKIGEKSIFQYNENGLIEKIYNIGIDDFISSLNQYTYNYMEKRILFTSYKSLGMVNYTYNYLYDSDIENGNCIEIEHRDSIGMLVMRVTNTYNSDNVRTEKAIYNSENKLDYKFTYTYTVDKSFSVITKINATGEVIKTDTYLYDNNGNLISVVTKDKNNIAISALSYTYG
jgi:hypothetical protein